MCVRGSAFHRLFLLLICFVVVSFFDIKINPFFTIIDEMSS